MPQDSPPQEPAQNKAAALNASGHSPAMHELSRKVTSYFREFIESDFKRAQAPRRRIQMKTQAGFRCGIDLRKYPAFFTDIWALMAKPAQEMALPLKRRKYRAEISPVLKNLVTQYVGQLDEQAFIDVRCAMVESLVAKRQTTAGNPDAFVDEAQEELAERAGRMVVRPLLALLEGAFKESSYSAEESIFEVEAELVELLCAGVEPHLLEPMNTLLLSGDVAPLQEVLAEFFCGDALRAPILEFFEVYAAADVFQEVRDILSYQHSDDQLTAYLYLGAIRFGGNDYPVGSSRVDLQACKLEYSIVSPK